jgi:hypothetical protein
MSSAQAGANPARRKPQGSGGRIVRSGLIGPKARPAGVVEGQAVETPPSPPTGERGPDAGGARAAADWKGPCPPRGVTAAGGDVARATARRRGRARRREKGSRDAGGGRTQTATGRRGEEPQVRGRPLVKELGKLPP